MTTTTTSTPAPIIRSAADGERRWFYGGGVHTWKATAEETNGAFLLFEDPNGPREGDAAAHTPGFRRDDGRP